MKSITSLFIVSASEVGIKWMADSGIGTGSLSPNILFWHSQQELESMVQVAEWHRKYHINHGISLGNLAWDQPWEVWSSVITNNIKKIYDLGILPNVSGDDVFYIDAETSALPVRPERYTNLYAPIINQIWDEHVSTRKLMVVLSPFIPEYIWKWYELRKWPYFVKRDQKKFIDLLSNDVSLDNKDLYITYAIQDGVGASLYPDKTKWDSRRVGSKDYKKFLRCLDALQQGNDRFFCRINAELFGVGSNGVPNGIATNERLQEQLSEEVGYSDLGLGPCWAYDEKEVGFIGYGNQKFVDFYTEYLGK